MFTEAQQQILKDELTNDPTNQGWSGMTDMEVCVEINKKAIIDNPEVAPKVSQYNLTQAIDPLIKATTVLNTIPTEELIKVRDENTGVGKLFYDRLLNFETADKLLDVSSDVFTSAVNFCKEAKVISAETAESLIGATQVLDVTRWHPKISSPSRAEKLSIFPAEVFDISYVRGLL